MVRKRLHKMHFVFKNRLVCPKQSLLWTTVNTLATSFAGQENVRMLEHFAHKFHVCVLRFCRRWPESRVHGGPVASKRGRSWETGTGLHLHPWTLNESWEEKRVNSFHCINTMRWVQRERRSAENMYTYLYSHFPSWHCFSRDSDVPSLIVHYQCLQTSSSLTIAKTCWWTVLETKPSRSCCSYNLAAGSHYT